MTSVDKNHYKNINVNETGDVNTSVQKISNNKEINSKCEVQLTNSAYTSLSAFLKEKLSETTNTYQKTDSEQLNEQKKQLQTVLVNTKRDLDESAKILQDLIKSYDTLNPDDALDQSITRINQSKVTDNVTNIRNKLKEAKNVIDKLNGGMMASDIFANTDESINKIKNKQVSRSQYLKNIIFDKIIEGKLYTSGFRLTNRNLNNIPCVLVSVDVNTKVYKVKYVNLDGKDAFVDVAQKNMCLVNDGKN
jgi:hypothetical protein